MEHADTMRKTLSEKYKKRNKKNEIYISLGTTTAKTKTPLDFIGFPGIHGCCMYEVGRGGQKSNHI